MRELTLINIERVAEILGCSIANVRYLIKRDFNPLPKHKAFAGTVQINDNIYRIPEHCKSKTKNKLVFVEEELLTWIKYQRK